MLLQKQKNKTTIHLFNSSLFFLLQKEPVHIVKLTNIIFICISTIISGLVEINPQFAEWDVETFRLYPLFSSTADLLSDSVLLSLASPALCLLNLVIPKVIVLIGAAVNHLCTGSSVVKMTSVRLGDSVQSQYDVYSHGRLPNPLELSPNAVLSPPVFRDPHPDKI